MSPAAAAGNTTFIFNSALEDFTLRHAAGCHDDAEDEDSLLLGLFGV